MNLPMNFSIAQIAAFSDNYALGKDNKLLWHYSEDMKFFRSMTNNKVMVMGRKTFNSFPKPLPGRHHVVISRSANTMKHDSPLVHFVSSVDAAITLAKWLVEENRLNPEIMICGGAEIYKQTLKISNILYLTRVKGIFEADTFYPQEVTKNFAPTLIRKSEAHPQELTYETWGPSQTLA